MLDLLARASDIVELVNRDEVNQLISSVATAIGCASLLMTVAPSASKLVRIQLSFAIKQASASGILMQYL